MVTGPAGTGKSTLLHETATGAEDRFGVLHGRGVELESGLAFGLVREIVERPLQALDQATRDTLLSGPASPLLALLEPQAAPAVESWTAIAHGLYWTLARLAHLHPVCILADDLHWADEESARTLAYVARRLAGHRILLMVAVRNQEHDHIDWPTLAQHEHAAVLRPAPLSPDATAGVVARALASPHGSQLTVPAENPAFAAVCHRLTGGNPQLLTELLAECRDRGIVPSDAGVDRLQTLTPAAVSRIVVERIGRLGPDAVALARSVAVLEEASFDVATPLAELDEAAATRAVERLIVAGVLADASPLRFAHPLARSAVVADLSRPARDQAHRKAAQLLAGHDPETAALHLLRAKPGHARWAADALNAAASSTLDRAAPATAVTLLDRALQEHPSIETQVALARALLAVGDPRAIGELDRALQAAPDPRGRAQLAVLAGQAQFVMGSAIPGVQTLRQGLADAESSGDPMLVDELMAAIAMIASDDAPLRERAVRHARSRTGDPRLEAVAAVDGFCRGRSAVEVARQARAGLATLSSSRGAEVLPTFHLAVWALAGCDEVEDADTALEAAFALARDRGSRLTYGIACFLRSWVRWLKGDLPGMLADAQESLDFAAEGWTFVVPNACWVQAEAALLQHDDRGCQAAIDRGLAAVKDTQWELSAMWLLVTRSGLRLRQGDAPAALEDALRAGRLATERLSPSPALHDWRGRAINAALALDQPEQAWELATDGLARAQTFGAPRTLALSHRNVALCRSGEERIQELKTASRFAAASPSPLVRAQVLRDLGVALRRNRQRVEARLPLQQAIDLARRTGATALADEAQSELNATGARRQSTPAWGTEALTPREHELARLAGQGLSNTEIAERLFITRKTVETHLSTIYRKLEISSRTALPAAMQEP